MNILSQNTFLLTGLLLNYDISPQIIANNINIINSIDLLHTEQIINKLLTMIFEDKKYPKELLINKFFEYTKWIEKEINVETLCIVIFNQINKLNNNEIIDIDLDEINLMKTHILSYYELIETKLINFIPYNYDELNKIIIKLINSNIIGKKDYPNPETHSGQPIPDPILGRPKLDWCVCQYKGCGKTFTRASYLTAHLQQLNAYTPGFHLSHEESVKLNNLTEEKVLLCNITKCPSWLCRKKDFSTPQDLIKHLQILGIEPFWKQGMVINDTDNDNTKIKTALLNDLKIYDIPKCVICLEDKANIIVGECYHQVYCSNCVSIINKSTIKSHCPICRGKAETFYPYA